MGVFGPGARALRIGAPMIPPPAFIPNPVDLSVVKLYGTVIFPLGTAIFFIWEYAESGFDWFTVYVAIGMLFAGLLVPYVITLYVSAREVAVLPHGVLLRLRLGRGERMVPWGSMARLSILAPEQRGRFGVKHGSIVVPRPGGKETGYYVCPSIAATVQEAYLRATGSVLPNPCQRSWGR